MRSKTHSRLCRWSNCLARAAEDVGRRWARERGLTGRVRVRCVRDHGRGVDGTVTIDGARVLNLEYEQFGRRRGIRALVRRHRRLRPPMTLVLALEAREVLRLLQLVAPGLIRRGRIRVLAVPDIVAASETRKAVARIISDFLDQELK